MGADSHVALVPNASAKMAQLLLMWADLHGHTTPEGLRFPLNMTQEAVGEAIGATRETVSRLLGDFQRRQLIRVQAARYCYWLPSNCAASAGRDSRVHSLSSAVTTCSSVE
jgi:hypothetical protein